MEEAGGDGAGGGGDSTALVVSTGTEVAAGDGTSDGGDSTGDGAVATLTADNEPVFEGGKLSQSASKTFRSLESANPNARTILGRAQRALGTVAKLTAMFGPKPFDRINALRKLEKEVGGAAGLQALREASDDLTLNDQLYERGDPQLIANMTEAPAAKQAFVKLFPHVVTKMRELAPKGYTRWFGAQIVSALEKLEMVTQKDADGRVIATDPIDMPFKLRRILSQLPQLQDGKFAGGTLTAEQQHAIHADLGQIYAWVEVMRSWANATPEDMTPAKEDTSAAAVAKARQNEDNAVQDAWATKRDSICNEILSDEVRKQTKDMNLSSTIIADITARARAGVNAIRKAKPGNHQKQHGYLEAKDQKGYLAYNKGIFSDHAPETVEKAVALYAKKSSRRTPAGATAARAAAPGTAGAQSQTTAQTGQIVKLTPQQAEKLGGRSGITRWMKQALIPGQPGTTVDMLKQGRYVLRKGNPANLPENTIVQL